MPGVTKDGKPSQSYGYDIGGQTKSISGGTDRGDKMPPHGQLGRLDSENTDRFIERKSTSESSKTYAKTGYESTAFDKSGNVKGASKSEPQFLEKDGSWAPAEGRGGVGSITKQNTNAVIKK